MTDIHVGGSHLREIAFQQSRARRQRPAGRRPARAPTDGVDHILSTLRLILAARAVPAASRSPRCSAGSRPGACSRRWPRSPRPRSTSARPRTSRSRIRVHADDEVGQLATRFNAMLERLETSRDALDESVRAQRQLVADASHELRTPVTSLRTNIEVLLAGAELERGRAPPDARRCRRAERGAERPGRRPDRARARRPAARADRGRPARPRRRGVGRPRAPQLPGRRASRPRSSRSIVEGVPERLGRAVNNLLDNAARHSPPDGVVEVERRRRGRPRPRPRPGLDADDLPLRVRPLLPRRRRTRAPGQRPRPRDRPPGGRAARRHRSASRTPQTAAPCSRCACPSCRPTADRSADGALRERGGRRPEPGARPGSACASSQNSTREHRDDHQQHRAVGPGQPARHRPWPIERHHPDPDRDRRDRGQQRGVRAVTRRSARAP